MQLSDLRKGLPIVRESSRFQLNPPFRFIVVLAGVLIGGACSGVDRSDVSWSVRDSAGVRIVESFESHWASGSAWLVAADPQLVIGAEAGPEAYLFHGLVAAGRLSDGRVYAADRGSGQIRFYSRTGDFLYAAGRLGDGPDEFASIDRVGVGRGDTIYAFDADSRRVSLVSSEGRIERMVTLRPETEGEIISAVWLPDGRFIGAIHDWAQTWSETPESVLGTLRYAVFDAGGEERQVVVSAPGNEAQLLSPTADYARFQIPLFAYRASGFIAHDALYFGMSRQMEIGVADFEGRVREIWRNWLFDPSISNDDVIAATRGALARRAPEWDADAVIRRGGLPTRRVRPPFSAMLRDSRGHLWVAEFVERDEDARVWSIFDPDGRLLGTVEVPGGFRIMTIGASEVIGRHVDQLGVESIWSLALAR